ncbi:MAG: SH3 domain-containing protein [Anaerolineae bacterium]
MVKRKKTHNTMLLAISLVLLLAACTGSSEETSEPASQPVEVQTVVVVATPTPEPEAAQPETGEEATTAPAGDPTMTALVDLNVRSGPGTNYPALTALTAGTNARILGKSPDGGWWKIECPAGTSPECWASASSQFSSAANMENVQVAAVPPAPSQSTSSGSGNGGTAATATVAATEVAQAQPTATTQAIGGGTTATDTPPPPTDAPVQPTDTPPPTMQPTPENTPTTAPLVAQFDNDSLQNPAQSVFFSITGSRNFSHSNDVSYPNGDQDDWVEFEFPNNSNSSQRVWVTLTCTINGDPGAQLRATIWENGQKKVNYGVICGQGEKRLTVDNTKTQQIQIHWGITKDGIYATYELTVIGFK